MNQFIKKIITCEVKEVEERVLEFDGSTECVDRMGDVVRADGWQIENYLKNPVFLWAHDYKTPPIGKAKRIWSEDGKLKFHIQFAKKDEYEFADTIYKLYKGGYLKATSVGFNPIEWEETESGFDFKKHELLELSACPVPANPEALVSAKTKGLLSANEFNLITKPEPDVTENYIRIRVRDPGDFQADSMRTIDISREEKIKAVVGRLKGEESTTLQSYLFDREKWSVSEAEKWVEEHKKNLNGTDWQKYQGNGTYFVENQRTLRDELDYCLELVKRTGVAEDNRTLAESLMNELSKSTGGITKMDMMANMQKMKNMMTEMMSMVDDMMAEEGKNKQALPGSDIPVENIFDAIKEIYNSK